MLSLLIAFQYHSKVVINDPLLQVSSVLALPPLLLVVPLLVDCSASSSSPAFS